MDTTNVDVDKDSPVSLDSLQFQDISHTPANSGDKEQTHTFTDFPVSATHDEEEDKTDLLKSDKQKASSFWTFEYYQAFFDVDTRDVAERILGSMVPNPRSNYLIAKIRPNPDLYGPFWVCSTLVFTTAIAGNLANYIQTRGEDYHWHYDFHKVTLAATAIFSYWWVIATLLWGMLRWRGSLAGFTYMEVICVYGYSLAVYIPISMLWVIQFSWLQWTLVIVGMVLSGGVLLLTFWPAVKEDNVKVAYSTMLVMFLMHGLLAVGFKLYFFNAGIAETHVTPSVNATAVAAVHETLTKLSNTAIGTTVRAVTGTHM
ncbi:Protein YIPF1 [Lamellibrachia satsuma]|nr:Protein YIPF1 [Lamellibrachia satsuma]